MTKESFHGEYIYVILCILSDLLSGFLVLYSKCVSKTKKIKKEEIRTQSELIYKKSEKLNKKFYIKLIIVVVLDYISRSSSWIAYAITKEDSKKISHSLHKNIKIGVDIIMRYIFSVFILKVVVFKHRIFSMITIGIGFAILITNDILLMACDDSSNYNIAKTFLYTSITLIGGFTYPLEDTFEKQIFSKEYLYPANLQFYRGIAETILISIITPILYFSFQVKVEFNSSNLEAVIPTIIICTLAAFVKAYITLKIIYHYSSQSVSFLRISQSFGGSITRIIVFFQNGIGDEWKIIFILLEIISIIIILFSSLIYDEIIIINKWELNKNVKIGIINRGEIEMENMSTFRDSKLDDNQLVEYDNNEIYIIDNANNENNEDEFNIN